MKKKVCGSCNQSSLVPEISGEFRDFDADEDLHGTIGIPLCHNCLGTGIEILDNDEFSRLQREVSRTRSMSLGIQIKAKENKQWKEEVIALNLRLKEIAERALELVQQPNEDCLAIKLRKGEW